MFIITYVVVSYAILLASVAIPCELKLWLKGLLAFGALKANSIGDGVVCVQMLGQWAQLLVGTVTKWTRVSAVVELLVRLDWMKRDNFLSRRVGGGEDCFAQRVTVLSPLLASWIWYKWISRANILSLFITKKHPQLLFFGVVAKVDQVQEEPRSNCKLIDGNF